MNGATQNQLENRDILLSPYCLVVEAHLFYVLLGVPEAPA
jgi:hypothetical protein